MLRSLLFALLLSFPLYGKVYDCFTFFNEWELLEVRLNELYDHVDHFVIVEAAQSHRGLPKPFRFEEQKERYNKFADKILYIKLNTLEGATDWERENFQKNQVMRGLKNCRSNDLILFSDLDEIPDKNLIPKLAKAIKKTPVIAIEQKMYRHFLNRRTPGPDNAPEKWIGTLAIRYKFLNKNQNQPNTLRSLICFDKQRTIPDGKVGGGQVKVPVWVGGWHFTSMGGFARFEDKCSNWTHWQNPRPKTVENWRREVEEHPLVPIDGTYPKYVQDNISYLIKVGLIEEPLENP